jgi:UDP-N-acetyl-D-mannosaminuronic acid transferase (WecB/TagA/CpsF family)
MADGSDAALATERNARAQVPSSVVAGIRSFAAEHGGAKAIIEYIGKRGARIVLVGADGVWGDQFASGTDVARQACAAAGVEVENGWERELMDQMRSSNDLWRSMGKRTLAR